MAKKIAIAKTKGELSAERILEATALCIAKYGIDESSITRIAQEARVSRALVAHYYPQKTKIFLQVIHYIVQKAYVEITEIPVADAWVRCQNIFRSNLNFFMKYDHYFKCFMLFYYMAGVDRECRMLNTQLTKVGVGRIQNALADLGIRDAGLADTLHTQLIGAILKFHSTQMGQTAEAFATAFLKNIQRQIKDKL